MTLGLMAGAGELPLVLARRARPSGLEIVTAALRGAASPRLRKLSRAYQTLSIGEVSALIRFFKRHGVGRVVMLGKVEHRKVLRDLKLDFRAFWAVARLKDRSGPALLGALASELQKSGVKVLDSRTHLTDLLAPVGFLTRRKPDAASRASVVYGLTRARAFAKWGVGQTLVVKKNAVVAVEAAEGTDECILRAGKLAGAGCVAVKVAARDQDWRFDVPAVGPATVHALRKARAAGMIFEAGRAFVLDRKRTVALAERAGIFLWAVR